MNVKYIVTHKGAAHRDDFLSTCIALAHYGLMPVYRRDVTKEELEDPEVLVLDTGEKYEPEKLNFDHHQFPRGAAPECALSLFVRFLGLEEAFKLKSWYQTTITMDSKGPFAVAKDLGMDKLPMELLSPVEGAILGLFGKAEALSERDCEAMQVIGKQLVENAREDLATYARIKDLVRLEEVNGLKAFVCSEEISQPLATSMNRYRDLEHPDVSLSVTKSDRSGESWALYRYDDHPAVDFSQLKGNENVLFSHPGGFIAKLKAGVSEEAAIELAKLAVG